MGKGLFLLLLLASSVASAQPDQRTHPERMNVCSDSGDCLLVEKRDGGYVGLIEGGTELAWNFQIDDFRLEHLKLTGVSTQKDSEGRNQVVVIVGKPDVIRDGIAYCKARYAVGRKSTSRKVTVTWEPPPPNIPALAH
jgi:hypothetical protein